MANKFIKEDSLIAVVGLGYVGLPLAVEFGKVRPTLGFDIDTNRIDALVQGIDETLEVSYDELLGAGNLKLSSDIELLREAKVFIIAVPTPIDEHKKPNLNPLCLQAKW